MLEFFSAGLSALCLRTILCYAILVTVLIRLVSCISAGSSADLLYLSDWALFSWLYRTDCDKCWTETCQWLLNVLLRVHLSVTRDSDFRFISVVAWRLKIAKLYYIVTM